jgi:hypothetical protein
MVIFILINETCGTDWFCCGILFIGIFDGLLLLWEILWLRN